MWLNILRARFARIIKHPRTQIPGYATEYHDVIALEDGERGETGLVKLCIETGDATPIAQSVRRVPFAVRKEVDSQIQEMLRNCVIQPSLSPWASPIVLVRKKDNTLRFCVDYRTLNEVTKPDKFHV